MAKKEDFIESLIKAAGMAAAAEHARDSSGRIDVRKAQQQAWAAGFDSWDDIADMQTVLHQKGAYRTPSSSSSVSRTRTAETDTEDTEEDEFDNSPVYPDVLHGEDKYDWREFCEDEDETGVDPEDYETEEDYEEALEAAKYGWREFCESKYQTGVDPEDYETEEDYEEALEAAKYGWREDCESKYQTGVDPDDYETEEEYEEALEAAKYGWREDCEDEDETGVDPEDYETEEEYEEALKAAKYGWREDCEDKSKTGVDPEDYETKEEYEEALGEIREENYPNKRRYRAAVELAESIEYGTEDAETACCRFIVEQADSVLAANYCSHTSGFLYAQAIKDHFSLPCSLPDEDEEQEIRLDEVLCKLAKRDVGLSLRVWHWCLDRFLPYAEYAEGSRDEMSDYVFSELLYFPDGFLPQLAQYMHDHDDFLKSILDACTEDIVSDLPDFLAAAIQEQLFDIAETVFRTALHKAGNNWKEINSFIGSMIFSCENDEELETMEFFRDRLFPSVKALDIGMVRDEIGDWEKRMNAFIDEMEDSGEKYLYSRKNAWRKTVPDGTPYDLDPVDYDSESEYLSALQREKYEWRKWHAGDENYGVDPEAFETEEEYNKAVGIKEQEAQKQVREQAEEKPKPSPAKQPEYVEDHTVYPFCGVLFKHASKAYSYRTDGFSVTIGDTVVVPVKDKELTGTVVSVGQYLRAFAPYPVERAKTIIRKIDEQIE